MVFDITQLKKIRRQLNLTQQQLAKQIGISQSMIAKIESEKLDPTYSYVKKIESAINELTNKEKKEAKDIMHKNIISVKKSAPVHGVIDILTKNDISQVPVIEKNNVFGLITETNLLNLNEEDLKNKKAEDIMKESPPIIDKDAKLSVISTLLKFYPIIIVKNKGKLEGVITKADVLKNLT